MATKHNAPKSVYLLFGGVIIAHQRQRKPTEYKEIPGEQLVIYTTSKGRSVYQLWSVTGDTDGPHISPTLHLLNIIYTNEDVCNKADAFFLHKMFFVIPEFDP